MSTKWAASLLSFCTFPAQSSLAQRLKLRLNDGGFWGVKLLICHHHFIHSLSASLPEVEEGDGRGSDEEKSGGRAHYVFHWLTQSFLDDCTCIFLGETISLSWSFYERNICWLFEEVLPGQASIEAWLVCCYYP